MLSCAIYGAAITTLRARDGAAVSAMRGQDDQNGGVADAERFVDDVYTMLLPLLVPAGVPRELEGQAGQLGHSW